MRTAEREYGSSVAVTVGRSLEIELVAQNNPRPFPMSRGSCDPSSFVGKDSSRSSEAPLWKRSASQPAQPGDAARTLAATGAEVLAVVTDVSDGSSVEALRDRTLERFGAVHLVHNNAGVEVGGPLWAVSESQWRWILGVNLWGVIHGIRVFVPLLLKQAAGHVVNTASLAGLSSPALMGPYNATKHGVVTISETLYRDLQLKGSPVGVSVL